MKQRKLTLRVDDLRVSTFAAERSGGVRGAEWSYFAQECLSQSCPGGMCVTKEYGGGETCETGPVYYC